MSSRLSLPPSVRPGSLRERPGDLTDAPALHELAEGVAELGASRDDTPPRGQPLLVAEPGEVGPIGDLAERERSHELGARREEHGAAEAAGAPVGERLVEVSRHEMRVEVGVQGYPVI